MQTCPTVYFVRNSLDRGALISFLLTLEGAEKCACRREELWFSDVLGSVCHFGTPPTVRSRCLPKQHASLDALIWNHKSYVNLLQSVKAWLIASP